MYGNSIGTRKTWIGVYLINDKFLDIGFKEKFKFKHHTSKFVDKLQQGVGLKQTNNSGINIHLYLASLTYPNKSSCNKYI